MGSSSVIVAQADGARVAPIDVGPGPTGLALDAARNRLYVLNRFDATVSLIDTTSNLETARVPFFDPTPAAIKLGRPLLYDTHRTSGLGQAACASCHVDGRTDHLAWDLGNPAGVMKPFDQTCFNSSCPPWHPMKGPMITQTLQGIVGNEPLHWRGDRGDLAAFAPAFTDLQGADAPPSAAEVQLMTDSTAAVRYPPNPNRNLDGTLPNAIPVTNGVGNRNVGLNIYNTLPTIGAFACIVCHNPFPGTGTDQRIHFPSLPLAPQNLKASQLRNLHERTGFSRLSQPSNRGFGYNHHSEFDTLFALLSAGLNFAPGPQGQQQRRDVEALMLCFASDTHAAVSRQVTLDSVNNNSPPVVNLVDTMIALGQCQPGRAGRQRPPGRYRPRLPVQRDVVYAQRRLPVRCQHGNEHAGKPPGDRRGWQRTDVDRRA